MKPKTIKSYLTKRFKKWVESIEDESVRKLVERNTIITGGSIVSLLQNERPNDIDIYFKDKETTKRVAQYYCEIWNREKGPVKNAIGHPEYLFVLDGDDVQDWKNGVKKLFEVAPNYDRNIPYELHLNGSVPVSHMITNTPPGRIKTVYPSDGVIAADVAGIEELDDIQGEVLDKNKKPFSPVFFTTNAITLSDKFQIILRFYGTPEEIHKNFDFVHCTCYYDLGKRNLVTPEPALLAIMNKDLIYQGSLYPVCSVFRTRKFIKKGWTINAGQYLKMCFQISQLDLTDIDVLEDQLIGVDTVYFAQLVSSIRKQMQKDEGLKLDNQYITTIIDRIF